MISRKQLIKEIVVEGYRYAVHNYHCAMCPPIRSIKRLVMRKLRLNRWQFDKILLSEGLPSYHEDGLALASCGSRVSSKLNYVTLNHEHPTFMNSFCFFEINPEIAKKIFKRGK